MVLLKKVSETTGNITYIFIISILFLIEIKRGFLYKRICATNYIRNSNFTENSEPYNCAHDKHFNNLILQVVSVI